MYRKRKWGGTEGEETVIRIYYMKKNPFSTKEEKEAKTELYILISKIKYVENITNTQITLEKI